jgi:hypothetical protein
MNSTDNGEPSNSTSQQQNQSIDVGQCFTANYQSLSLPGESENSVKIALISANLPNGPFFSPAGTGCNTSAFLQATYSLKPVDSSRSNEDDHHSSKPNLYLTYELNILSNGSVIRTINGRELVPSLSENKKNTDNDSNHKQHHKPQPRIYITITTQWDGKDTNGNKLTDGVYSYSLHAQYIKVTNEHAEHGKHDKPSNHTILLKCTAPENGIGTPVYYTIGNKFNNDIWVYDTNTHTWSKPAISGTPPIPMRYQSAVYDSNKNRMVVFGGDTENDVSNYVYFLDLNTMTWVQVNPSGTPPEPRFGQCAVYDSANQRMLMFGGNTNMIENPAPLNDLWQLNLDKY